ncbi:hypothetical protein D1632_10780 [Chryseobacterium nematophagum]|uniref:Uncharacterized protein n=1 Tax=Chryseobacterium nematophagum TaxID=2305228 RepID=A0A3M7LDA9_9FLAO|nr:hypothetical protein [Chryseobacterium nematophagum]RMZ60065.1 hypothetical protein D1632_10780 [Chryseobacterium nematophagum]
MEIKNKGTVKDLISENLEIFFKLDLLGIKNINTAIDYLSICETYQKYLWIKKKSDREKVVADHCKVSIISVKRALLLMNQEIIIEDKNLTS